MRVEQTKRNRVFPFSGVRRFFNERVSMTSHRDDAKILRHHNVTSLAVFTFLTFIINFSSNRAVIA